MELEILQILALCMQAREKGHDCFFDYSPHVETISVNIYKNGWKSAKGLKKMLCRIYNQDFKSSDTEFTLEEIRNYLEQLIKED